MQIYIFSHVHMSKLGEHNLPCHPLVFLHSPPPILLQLYFKLLLYHSINIPFVSYISFGLNIMLSNRNYHDNGSSFVEYWPQSSYLAGGWISFCNQDISIEGVMLYSMDQYHTSNQSACYCDVHIWFFTLMNSSNISSAAGPTLSFW